MPLPTVKDTRHGRFMYFSNDDYIGRSLDNYGEYSEIEWKLYSQFLQEGMLIIDGGANIGAFTIPFGKTVQKTGVVYAFEPQIELFNMLVGNIALNDLSRWVKPIWGALGDKQGMIDVACLDYDIFGNFGGLGMGIDPIGVKLAEGEKVFNYYQAPLYTIDSLNLAGCSMIKLDVEGMELVALMGALQTIKAYSPAIYVENNDRVKSAALIDFLFQNDYRCWWDFSPMENSDNYFGCKEKIFEGYVNINMLCLHKSRKISINNGLEVEDINEWEQRFKDRITGYK